MDDITKKIIPILQKYQIKKAAFFGSYVRGEKYNDIDVLVDCPEDMDLLEFIGCEQDIEDQVGTKIDLVSYKGISPVIETSVLKDEKIFYEHK